MHNAPRITIVTISFNQNRFLEQAVRSIAGQSYPNLEYIVVDPGSTDGSRETIDRLAPLITHRILDPDNGPAHGLNRGFAAASGEIFGFINADDILLDGALSYVGDYFHRQPDVDVLLGCGTWVDENGKVVRRVVPSRFSIAASSYGRFEFIQQGTFFRRSAFERCGGFNERNRVCWDGELLFSLAQAGARFARSARELGAFRTYAGTITDSQGYFEKLRNEEARIYGGAALGGGSVGLSIRSAGWLMRKWLLDPWYIGLRLSRNFSKVWSGQ